MLDVKNEEEVGAIERHKRESHDSDGVPIDQFNTGRNRRSLVMGDKRPFHFGSSDRFSHGFGKRHSSNSLDTASVCLSITLCLSVSLCVSSFFFLSVCLSDSLSVIFRVFFGQTYAQGQLAIDR